jgi:molybdopterin synthase catalytic subunit
LITKIIFQKEPIDPAAAMKALGTDADGAVVTFVGRARNESGGKRVKRLEYEIYEEMARREMEKIIDGLSGFGLNSCVVIHRYGSVEIGEASIFIGVSSPHREESFRAARSIIDAIKKTVPLWKKEFYSDGSTWISERS